MQKSRIFESESIPGATYELRVIGRQFRHRAELELADLRHKQRMLDVERLALLGEYSSVEELVARLNNLSEDDSSKLDNVGAQIQLLDESAQLEYIRRLLLAYTLPGDEYEGLSSVEDLLEYGPEPFATEIMKRAAGMWSLTKAEEKNSSRPSTSQEQVDGPIPTSDTNAPLAVSEEITEPATAS